MEIRFLGSVEQTVLHQAFLRAFSDYVVPLKLTPKQFEDMMIRRGVDMSLSVGAFENGDLVGFNLNGIGIYDEVLSIYDSGTGTVPEFRRRGIAETLFRHSLPFLKDHGAIQYILEVFRQNTAAVKLYEKIGFRIVRELESFRRSAPVAMGPSSGSEFTIREIVPDWTALQLLWNWQPSWQNSIASVQRSQAARITLGVFYRETLVGYGIVFPESGDIPHFCVDRAHRNKGAASALLHELQKAAQTGLRTINVDASDDAALRFLQHQGFERIGSQYEMKMDL